MTNDPKQLPVALLWQLMRGFRGKCRKWSEKCLFTFDSAGINPALNYPYPRCE